MKVGGALFAIAVSFGQLHAQLTMILSVPAATSDTVSVAGNFNGWNPSAPGYFLRMVRPGEYAVTLPGRVSGHIEFKFTLGNWDRVEVDSTGKDVQNRSMDVPGESASTYSGTVARWKDAVQRPRRMSSRRPTVRLLDSAFGMPQLHRTFGIWLCLPQEYAASGGRYPVLYMNDGQNLFDDATSFAGEWGVDETLDSLRLRGYAGCIVVGIENAGSRRTGDYSPWGKERYGEGRGDAYVDFIVTTLKPYIDKHYRTLPDRMHTAIAGSSLGANISLYAALKYPDVFGTAGIFSAALWFNPEIYHCAATLGPTRPRSRLIFLTGTMEGSDPADHLETMNAVRKMVDTLASSGYRVGASVDTLFYDGGEHTEWFWRATFPDFYGRWMKR